MASSWLSISIIYDTTTPDQAARIACIVLMTEHAGACWRMHPPQLIANDGLIGLLLTLSNNSFWLNKSLLGLQLGISSQSS